MLVQGAPKSKLPGAREDLNPALAPPTKINQSEEQKFYLISVLFQKVHNFVKKMKIRNGT
jgi:hypothetical protein